MIYLTMAITNYYYFRWCDKVMENTEIGAGIKVRVGGTLSK